MPFVFERLETGKSGLVSQHAVVAWDDSHYFVSQDDIYKISISGGLASINCPLLEETLYNTKDLNLTDYIQIEHDVEKGDIVFLFPTEISSSISIEGISTRLWRYNYETKAWSYDEINFKDEEKTEANFYYTGLLSSKFYLTSSTWEDWQDSYNPITEPPPTQPDATGEASTEAWMPLKDSGAIPSDPEDDVFDATVTSSFFDWKSWHNLKSESLKHFKLYPTIFVNSADGKQLITEEFPDNEVDWFGEVDATLNATTYPIWAVLESADLDFDMLDTVKTATRLSVKTRAWCC